MNYSCNTKNTKSAFIFHSQFMDYLYDYELKKEYIIWRGFTHKISNKVNEYLWNTITKMCKDDYCKNTRGEMSFTMIIDDKVSITEYNPSRHCAIHKTLEHLSKRYKSNVFDIKHLNDNSLLVNVIQRLLKDEMSVYIDFDLINQIKSIDVNDTNVILKNDANSYKILLGDVVCYKFYVYDSVNGLCCLYDFLYNESNPRNKRNKNHLLSIKQPNESIMETTLDKILSYKGQDGIEFWYTKNSPNKLITSIAFNLNHKNINLFDDNGNKITIAVEDIKYIKVFKTSKVEV